MDANRLRSDALAIVAAAIEGVRPERLVARRLGIAAGELLVDGRSLAAPLRVPAAGRIAVVGGGKAAAGLAAGLAMLLEDAGVCRDRLMGLVSVPEGCGRTVAGIEVRETRPAAVNLPTSRVVAATREMRALLEGLTPTDLAIAVISGGGSAVVEAPRADVQLDDVIAVASHLSAAGAEITELNLVRQAGSEVKGGGLARACRAGRLLVIVLSDVIGDPLEFIASGPCLPVVNRAAEALAVLERYGAVAAEVAPSLVAVLRKDADRERASPPAGPEARQGVRSSAAAGSWTTPAGCRVDHLLLAGNATAVEAAAAAAGQLGYADTVRPAAAGQSETADMAGRRLAREGVTAAAATDGRPRAIIEGGEAVVRLPKGHGRGGRNQQTAVAALAELAGAGVPWPAGLLLASLGTDGEDGPTDAAGGVIDAAVAAAAEQRGLDPAAAVARCDAWPFLDACGGLLVTGPTGTNVADIRIVLARP